MENTCKVYMQVGDIPGEGEMQGQRSSQGNGLGHVVAKGYVVPDMPGVLEMSMKHNDMS